jgi:hypothetical protein
VPLRTLRGRLGRSIRDVTVAAGAAAPALGRSGAEARAAVNASPDTGTASSAAAMVSWVARCARRVDLGLTTRTSFAWSTGRLRG